MKQETYIYNGIDIKEAYKKTTQLAIAAHQDDVEFMAIKGILDCFVSTNENFAAVILSDGKSSPRDGKYSNYTNDEMNQVRNKEQKKAAFIGEYSFLELLNYTSEEIKDNKNTKTINKIKDIIQRSNPEIIYTHNLFDKHDTHIAVALKTISAIRSLDKNQRPKKVYGCEVWRSLDWVCDIDKVIFDVSDMQNLSNSLMGVFDSQISGGKRYDLATTGRRLANATYGSSHSTDEYKMASYAVDLTPLIEDDNLDITDFVTNYLNRFKEEIKNNIKKFL